MEFCPRCGKVLLPKDGYLYCFDCHYKQDVDESDRKNYIIEEDVSDKQDILVSSDKVNAMPTTKGLCYRCGNRELEWWMVQMHRSDEAETRFYRCTKCGNTWRRSN